MKDTNSAGTLLGASEIVNNVQYDSVLFLYPLTRTEHWDRSYTVYGPTWNSDNSPTVELHDLDQSLAALEADSRFV